MSLYDALPPPESEKNKPGTDEGVSGQFSVSTDNQSEKSAQGTYVSKEPVTYTAEDKKSTEQEEKDRLFISALQFQPALRKNADAKTKKPITTGKPIIISQPQNVEQQNAEQLSTQDRTDYGWRQKNRSKRRKKPRDEGPEVKIDWDDTYDPAQPNHYEHYIQSDERFMEDEDWKDFLLNLKSQRKWRGRKESRSPFCSPSPKINPMFAPPIDLYSSAMRPENDGENTESALLIPSERLSSPLHENTCEIQNDSSTVISSAPVIYDKSINKSLSISEVKANEPSRQKSTKETFAKRLLSKYGWTPGSGLGANSTGITKALHFSADKRVKGHGKIIDRNQKIEDNGKFGAMSKVIVMMNLIEPGEVDEELATEIGEECGEKYGNVERVFIHEQTLNVNVYVKFNSELSALRAVNGLHGRLFNGNSISTKFYDETDFENGIYA
ncbi:hypothetical protein V1511DRAFT_497640 [Dipodascopsis uninucleata]